MVLSSTLTFIVMKFENILIILMVIVCGCTKKETLHQDETIKELVVQKGETYFINSVAYQSPFEFADAVEWTGDKGYGFALMDNGARILPFCIKSNHFSDAI